MNLWYFVPFVLHGDVITVAFTPISLVTKACLDTMALQVFESDLSDQRGLLDNIRSMRVKEIKEELRRLEIPTDDVFEKEQLVERLFVARRRRTNPKKAETVCATTNGDVPIRAPLVFTSLDSDESIPAANFDGGITVNPGDEPYATMELKVVEAARSSFTLNLLLDTACSGFVLRPSIVEKYELPKLSTPVTMTGAGGSAGATGLTQLACFEVGGKSFGPLPAAVQDIGALPSSLDGILGLSFFHQFTSVDFVFSKGEVVFYPPKAQELLDLSVSGTLVTESTLELVSNLGIYAVDVWFGNRGPVKMLLDTGAASTFLNWNGVRDLGIKRDDSSFLERLKRPTGAMGSDNIAMKLSHRLYVSSSIALGKDRQAQGISFKGTKRLAIDIGDIGILEVMKEQSVHGILGIDALMRCTNVRLRFDRQEIQLFQ